MDFFHTTITPRAIELVNETLASGFLSEGERVVAFERALTNQLLLLYPVTTNSGTSALEVALKTLQVKRGDEVITTPQSFIATTLAVLNVGAVPVFADINPRTGNLDPDSVREKITDKTIGILPVHYGGYPANLDELNSIAETYGLFVVDDAAHALGATYKDNPIGCGLTEATCFSFQATKLLSTADGGCVCFQNEFFANLARKYRWFGIDRINDLPDELGERSYLLSNVIGGKYHLSDFSAALGLGNLDGFEKRIAKRRWIATRYSTELADVAGLELLDYERDYNSLKHNETDGSFYLYPVLVEKRLDFVRAMKERDVPVKRVHRRVDVHPICGGINRDLVGQAEFEERHICLPIHDGLTSADVDLVIDAVKEGW